MDSIIAVDRTDGLTFSRDETTRYARHFSLPEVGADGQGRLKAARVLCIGAGGLGSPVLMYLAAAGIGEIGLIDPDTVDLSNLQRQILHDTSDVGRLKVESARDRLTAINPEIRLTTFPHHFTSENAATIAAPYDVLIDGTDNFATRYLSNDLAVLTGKPNVYGSIYRFEGQVSVFAPHLGGPCYRCLFPKPPAPDAVPSCAEGGVLGVLPGIVGCLQANEAIKLILGIGEPLVGRLVHFDALAFRFREIRLRRDTDCALCGESPSITRLADIDFTCAMPLSPALPEIDVHELQRRMASNKPFVLLDVREISEYEVARLPGSLLIPLGELPERLGELDPEAPTIVHCKAGGRSAKALALLKEAGFTDACHVKGGINAWSQEIDPSVPYY
jgi:sulfur-carrier protein adenylyltransferase/sulfurtransferase